VTFRVRYTGAARDDLRRLYQHLLDRDVNGARRARIKIAKGVELLKEFPFTCRKASPDSPFLRELVISFGSTGYVMLSEIQDASTVTILAVRHEREDDYLQ
jgi:plasmid stabilization system protein ParE